MELIENANKEALEIFWAESALVDVVPAREAISGSEDRMPADAAMESALREVGDPRHVAALLTQIEVDAEDPAFNNPTKFVGPFFSEAESARIGQELGWLMREDSGRGFRHVVPSPSALVVLPA